MFVVRNGWEMWGFAVGLQKRNVTVLQLRVYCDDIPAPANCGVYWSLNISGMYSGVKLQTGRPTVTGVSITVQSALRHSLNKSRCEINLLY
jgi:hypothetical protein